MLSLNGDIALDGDRPTVHAHAVLGPRNSSTIGGHLLQASVQHTLEVLLIESPSYLSKTCDRESGLALIDIDARAERPAAPAKVSPFLEHSPAPA